jgi:hypothetical protein
LPGVRASGEDACVIEASINSNITLGLVNNIVPIGCQELHYWVLSLRAYLKAHATLLRFLFLLLLGAVKLVPAATLHRLLKAWRIVEMNLIFLKIIQIAPAYQGNFSAEKLCIFFLILVNVCQQETPNLPKRCSLLLQARHVLWLIVRWFRFNFGLHVPLTTCRTAWRASWPGHGHWMNCSATPCVFQPRGRFHASGNLD